MTSALQDSNFSDLIAEREALVNETRWIERLQKGSEDCPMDLDETIETLRAIRLRIYVIDLKMAS